MAQWLACAAHNRKAGGSKPPSEIPDQHLRSVVLFLRVSLVATYMYTYSTATDVPVVAGADAA